LKRLLLGMVTALAVILAAAFVAPLLIPDSVIKGQVASFVRQKTGRELHIGGSISFSLLPRLALVAHDVRLSNPPGGFSADLLIIKTVEISLKPLALLHSAIEIDQLNLAQPTINFEVDKQGRRNWIFHRAAQAASTEPPAQSGGGLSFASANLTIADGTASYLDQRDGKKRVATDLNMTLSVPSLAEPLQAAGTAIYNTEAVRFALNLGSPGTLRDGGTSAAALDIAAPRASFNFNGDVAGAGPNKASGAIAIKMASFRDFLLWTELPFKPRGSGFGAFSVDAKMTLAGRRLTLADAAIALDDVTANGTLAVDRGGERPALSGHLDIDRLDLTPYFKEAQNTPATAAPSTPPASAPSSPAAPTPPAAPPTPAPVWSDNPIDLAPLKRADANLTLVANAIRMGGIEIGKSTIALQLKDGRLELDPNQMALYNGNGTGEIVIDGSGTVPAFATSLKLIGITVRRVPIGIAGFDELGGTGDVYLLLSGRGRSLREWVASLNGGASLAFANGMIGSASLSPLMKNSLGPAVNDKSIPREIDYRSLSGTAIIDRGVLRNGDLKLSAAQISAVGAGNLDLTQRRIDYLWQPDIPGLGSARMAITGTWDAPLYKVESVTITKGTRAPPTRQPGSR
jgi:AsmA protein